VAGVGAHFAEVQLPEASANINDLEAYDVFRKDRLGSLGSWCQTGGGSGSSPASRSSLPTFYFTRTATL